ncbi:MAG: hypothetical protein AAFY70_08490, partial [Bacteroidota bacterium]
PVTTTGQGALVFANTVENMLPENEFDMSPEQIVGVAYFSAGEIAQIQPGMRVLLIPDVDGGQVAGGLQAEVLSVSQPSVTTIEAARESRLDDSYVEVVTIPRQDEEGDFIRIQIPFIYAGDLPPATQPPTDSVGEAIGEGGLSR